MSKLGNKYNDAVIKNAQNRKKKTTTIKGSMKRGANRGAQVGAAMSVGPALRNGGHKRPGVVAAAIGINGAAGALLGTGVGAIHGAVKGKPSGFGGGAHGASHPARAKKSRH